MFSLQAIKHITTIDGGVLMCQNEEDYQRGRLLRWYGIDRNSKGKDFRCEEDIQEWGYKFHMNDICAVIGIEQMKYVDGIVEKNRANAKFLDAALQGLRGGADDSLGGGSAVGVLALHDSRRSAPGIHGFHEDQGRDGLGGPRSERYAQLLCIVRE